MSEKCMIKVEVCCGTTCFLLGARELLALADDPPAAWQGRVEVIATPCMDACNGNRFSGSPYVRINGTLLSGATRDLVEQRVNAIMAKPQPERSAEQ
ncbi:(2Fe-2S) ferredoxin domain-containing protein [Oligosphaera ethanolica]|uniref:NADH:ubiquinone oxidoreductase subunit E n=1 Tax=Oligosphaera ethanolica TaxID=760260 RepID=A0AAE4ANE5_9BACT|nr:(2Fe-2S) ferredoxin domain-containing protein [Oligosphaera ethanolica]MDQ0289300.1 NADH:ubiquinone oxidoreductase subunit E [Oligosphaera ethanolica]